jgi:hypothetical protein
MEKIEYAGWPNCVRLANSDIELVATTDVGPRILRFGFKRGRNLFKEFKDQLGRTGGEEWRPYGGHRFWHAPEDHSRTYAPDNAPISSSWDRGTLALIQPLETRTNLQKRMLIKLHPDRSQVTVVHRLINRGAWDIEAAPWALTVLVPGGRAILPQEPFRPHPEVLQPARPLVLWPYTDMQDSRFTWGRRFIQVQQEPKAKTKLKIGVRNSLGWAAYCLRDLVFIKRYALDPAAAYPDFGCNTEVYADPEILELETLGPLSRIPAGDGAVEHTEHWFLFKEKIGPGERAIERKLLPLVDQTSDLLGV